MYYKRALQPTVLQENSSCFPFCANRLWTIFLSFTAHSFLHLSGEDFRCTKPPRRRSYPVAAPTPPLGLIRAILPRFNCCYSQHDLYWCSFMELNSTFATNVCIHAFKEKIAPLSSLTETFFLSFLTVGAGFALTKAKVFPTEAA